MESGVVMHYIVVLALRRRPQRGHILQRRDDVSGAQARRCAMDELRAMADEGDLP